MPQLVGYSQSLVMLGTIGGGNPPVGAGSDPAEVTVNAVHFDGTNDFLTRGADLTGNADTDAFLLSLWFDMTGGDAANKNFVDHDNDRINLTRLFGGAIRITLRNSSDTILWTADTDVDYTTSTNSGWNHLLIAANLGSTPTGLVYVNDAQVSLTESTSPTTGTIDWTTTDYEFGGVLGGGQEIDADIAEVYMTNETLDISMISCRRKFISSNGKPVDLESDGSGPTGTAALIYFSGATATWHTNDGTGGGFTENGALTDGSSSPSD